MSHDYPHPRRNLRPALADFLTQMDLPHALTLNADRELSAARIGSIFGTFCQNIDRLVHGRQRVTGIPTDDRLRAVAFPEHLETNAHLHVALDLRPLQQKFRLHTQLEREVGKTWLKSNHGAGSIFLEALTSNGWHKYMMKEGSKSDPLYFLSSDFHPH